MNKKIKIITILLLSVLVLASLQSSASEKLKVNINDVVEYNDTEYSYTEVNKVQNELLKEIKQRKIETMKEEIIKENKKIYTALEDFVVDVSGLSREDSSYLIQASEDIGVDTMLMLSLIRVESYFDPYLVGTSGERGIGQLMANTAKPVAESIGIEYDPDKLFEPQYNILLFTTQFKYLLDYYDGDLHKTLTAYNRGQYGLKKYMASRSSHSNPEVSVYSSTILEYAAEYKNQFDNNK